ncbi:MAG: HNH endonuclease [Pseudomonadota bacterium]
MAFGVFIHRSDSIYDDIPDVEYQFPKQYYSRAEKMVGDWIIYYEPKKNVVNSRGYFAAAKVQEIVPDPRAEGMFLAIIAKGSYLEFGSPVPLKVDNRAVELGLLNEKGNFSGRAQSAVRPISGADFSRIIELGLGHDEQILPRDVTSEDSDSIQPRQEFNESQAAFDREAKRKRIDILTNRSVRDRNFRKTVLRAYGETCAITGLKLINGGGRAEVEAAHIKPVECDGPDIIGNGLALSGTAHWMFDRGLVGIAENHDVLVSRHSNDEQAVKSLINKTGKILLPERISDRPRAEFIEWHRNQRFKS